MKKLRATRSGLLGSSKGQTVLDGLTLLIVMFVLAIVAVIAYMGLNSLNDDIQASADFTATSKSASQQITDQYPNYLDNAFLFVLILFWILLIVSAFLIDSHPIFFGVMIILLCFVFVVGMALSNAYEELTDDADLSPYKIAFPKTEWIMDHLLLTLIVIGMTSALALYAKNTLL